jgi:hypothetical protein
MTTEAEENVRNEIADYYYIKNGRRIADYYYIKNGRRKGIQDVYKSFQHPLPTVNEELQVLSKHDRGRKEAFEDNYDNLMHIVSESELRYIVVKENKRRKSKKQKASSGDSILCMIESQTTTQAMQAEMDLGYRKTYIYLFLIAFVGAALGVAGIAYFLKKRME